MKKKVVEFSGLKPKTGSVKGAFLFGGDYVHESSARTRGEELLKKGSKDVIVYVHGAGGKNIYTVYYVPGKR